MFSRTQRWDCLWFLANGLGAKVIHYCHGHPLWGRQQGCVWSSVVVELFIVFNHVFVIFISYLLIISTDWWRLSSQIKCAQYWPSLDRETEIFDDFVVKIRSEQHCPDYIIRHLILNNVSVCGPFILMCFIPMVFNLMCACMCLYRSEKRPQKEKSLISSSLAGLTMVCLETLVCFWSSGEESTPSRTSSAARLWSTAGKTGL